MRTEDTAVAAASTRRPASTKPHPIAAACGIEEQWERASHLLASHPRLVTPQILCTALKHRPPLSVVKSFLILNPKAAISVPCSSSSSKKHPVPSSALQVALQSACSLAVIECLIRAWPQALELQDTVTALDPLQYAKKFRSKETELIQLLSLPVSHWIPERKPNQPVTTIPATITEDDDDDEDEIKEDTDDHNTSFTSTTAVLAAQTNGGNRATLKDNQDDDDDDDDDSASSEESLVAYGANGILGASPCPRTLTWVATPISMVPRPPPAGGAADLKNYAAIDPQELANVKQICVSVLRGHRRLSAELKVLLEEREQQRHGTGNATEATATTNASQEETSRTEQLLTMDKKLQELELQMMALMQTVNNSNNQQPVVVQQPSEKQHQFDDDWRDLVEVLENTVQRLEVVEKQLAWQTELRVPVVVPDTKSASTTTTTATRTSSMFYMTTSMPAAGPMVYPSPPSAVYVLPDHDEDIRSLLTEDSLVLRRQQHQRQLAMVPTRSSSSSDDPKSLLKQWRLLLCHGPK